MPVLDLYNYRGKITRIIDGDTVQVTIALGLDVQLNNQILRLKGIGNKLKAVKFCQYVQR